MGGLLSKYVLFILSVSRVAVCTLMMALLRPKHVQGLKNKEHKMKIVHFVGV
jgi:hypothetical protein